MDSRAIRLEEKVAHLERYVADLDGVVREMNERMDRFARETKALRAIVEAARKTDQGPDGTADDDLLDERPPHW